MSSWGGVVFICGGKGVRRLLTFFGFFVVLFLRGGEVLFFSGGSSLHLGVLLQFLQCTIDHFHKWLTIINSFVIIKISLTNLGFELVIQLLPNEFSAANLNAYNMCTCTDK